MLNEVRFTPGQSRILSGKKISLFLGFMLIIGLAMNSSSLFAFAGGDGSSGNPYHVSNAIELNDVRNYLSSYFIQTADIDLDVSPYNIGDGWNPIGTFRGSYNGQVYTISNLYINRSTTDNIGLFGYTSGATIQNLGVTNVDITGNDYVGGLVGYNNISSTVSNSYSTGSVSGNTSVGGLAGRNYNGSIIEYCYSTGSVSSSGSGNTFVGGLVGYIWASSATVSNSYSTCSVVSSSGSRVGGLVGYNSSQGIVSNCYSTGSVIGNDFVGGLVGDNFGTEVSNSFWDTETSGQSISDGGIGKTTAEMKTQSTFTSASWNFTTVWQMIGTNYPDLLSNSNPVLPVKLSSFTASCLNGTVTLNWTTESEINNSGFDIERKRTENVNWMKIGFVEGHGTVNTHQSYINEDRNLTAGKYSYRLKQIDHNGNFEYFYLNSYVFVGAPSKFNVSQNYPNPFNPKTKINFKLPVDSKVNIKIFDMLGREIATLVNGFKEAGYYTMEFNGSYLSSGMYFYRVQAKGFEVVKTMLLTK